MLKWIGFLILASLISISEKAHAEGEGMVTDTEEVGKCEYPTQAVQRSSEESGAKVDSDGQGSTAQAAGKEAQKKE